MLISCGCVGSIILSNIDGDGRDLNNFDRVRGVRYDNAVGVAQKNSELYSPMQFFAAMDKVGLSVKGDLEKAVLETLRK